MNTYKNYLRLYWNTTRKTQLIYLGCIPLVLILMTAMGMANGVLYNISAEQSVSLIQSRYISNAQIVLIIFAALSGSSMYSAMRDKAGRLTTLCLPTSQSSKFWAYFTIYVLGFLGVFIVSIFVVDWLRVAVLSLAGYGAYAECTPAGALLSMSTDLIDGNEQWSIYSTLVWCTALGVLCLGAQGSIFFLNKALVKNTAFYIGLGIVCMILIFSGFNTFFEGHFAIPRFKDDIDMTRGEVAAVFWVVTLLVFAGCMALSYLRFKESETQNRW